MKSFGKDLRKLPQEVIAEIVMLVETLVHNPIPVGARKVAGTKQVYRLRAGNYRIVYKLLKHALVLEIIRVGHRKDVYQKLS